MKLMAHRGPDGVGFQRLSVTNRPVLFGHLRLAIIDLDRRSDQPMTYEDGRYWLIFNGEIYNYRELRAELEAQGRVFRTQSDSEVLMVAWATWGPACLDRFVGMFAFLLLDAEKEEIIVARDPFGIKPLYWAKTAQGLAFSSEIPPLLEQPGVGRRLNAARAWRYLRDGGTDHGSETFFQDVRCVPAAHWARLSLKEVEWSQPQFVKYWSPKIETADWTFEEATKALRTAFLNSVQLHLRSDVPVGAALSGGIDSSAIIGGMRRVSGSTLDLHCFTFVAPGYKLDESRWAVLAAESVQAHWHPVRASPEELAHDIDGLIKLQAEPFGSTSIYAQYRVMQTAGQNGMKVMLDGQGADELFAGYRPFLAARLNEFIRQGKMQEAAQFLMRLSRRPDTSPLAVSAQTVLNHGPAWLANSLAALLGHHARPDWLNPSWFQKQGAWGDTRPSPARNLKEAMLESMGETILPALLRYEDRNSMAWSMESRVPFLTRELAELAFSLPPAFLINEDGTSKHILREAMRGIAPDEILNRRDKIGFATPEKDWLGALGPWINTTLSIAKDVPLFEPQKLRPFFELNRRNPKSNFTLWRILNFLRWSELFSVTH